MSPRFNYFRRRGKNTENANDKQEQNDLVTTTLRIGVNGVEIRTRTGLVRVWPHKFRSSEEISHFLSQERHPSRYLCNTLSAGCIPKQCPWDIFKRHTTGYRCLIQDIFVISVGDLREGFFFLSHKWYPRDIFAINTLGISSRHLCDKYARYIFVCP